MFVVSIMSQLVSTLGRCQIIFCISSSELCTCSSMPSYPFFFAFFERRTIQSPWKNGLIVDKVDRQRNRLSVLQRHKH